MSENTAKTPWYSRQFARFLDPKVLAPILIALAGGGGWGAKILADAGGVTRDTVKAIADSTTRAAVEPLKTELAESRAENRAAFGALMDALPAFRKAVQERGQANADAMRKKEEADTLLKNLTIGGSR